MQIHNGFTFCNANDPEKKTTQAVTKCKFFSTFNYLLLAVKVIDQPKVIIASYHTKQ